MGYIDGIHGAPYIAAPWILVDPFDPQQSESVTGPWAHGFPAGERQETHEIGLKMAMIR